MDKYSFHLPPEQIAQTPARPRDHSRLLAVNKISGRLSHHRFYELPRLLLPGDVLVFNNSAVFPARLYGRKNSGGKVEILLLRKINASNWEFISHPGLKPGQKITFSHNFSAEVDGFNNLKLSIKNDKLLTHFGHTPLPPYIHSEVTEKVLRKQYQTVYAGKPGSAAAPTAGLHFTHRLLNQLSTMNYQQEFVTLHVGLGTFKPPGPDQLQSGTLHYEWFTLPSAVTRRLNAAKSAGHRIIAVGTTSVRVLETCSDKSGMLHPRTGYTNIFIRPPYRFKFVDGMITNFHLPGTSLIMLVSAMASWPVIRRAYQAAITEKYRFFSFGDACLIA